MSHLHPMAQLSVVPAVSLVPFLMVSVVHILLSWVGPGRLASLLDPQLEDAFKTSNSSENITKFFINSMHN